MRTAANILLLIVAVAVHVIWIRSLVEWDGSPCDAADCKDCPYYPGENRKENQHHERTMTQILNAATPILCLLITAGGAYLVALLKRQTAQIEKDLDNETAAKYMNMAVDAVAQAVAYTAQTFADSLKAEGKFTKEKQLEAFEKSKNKTLEILGDTTVAALREIYGDFDAWLETKIEQVCRETKAASESQIKAATADAATTAASVAATIATTAVQQLAAEAPAAESKTE